MAGNNSVVGLETITFTDNMSFDGTERGGAMTTNGQLWIGSTASRHVKLGSITSPLGTVTIGYASPNITLDITGGSNAVERVALQTGTTPIVPTGGTITFNGAVVAAGTNPVRTDGTGANTMALEVQTSQALAAADATKIGLSNFDSSSFAVAATGFVTLSTTGAGKTITGDSGGALSPTANNWNILGLSGSKTSGAASTLTIKSPPYSDVAAPTTVTLNSGSFATAAITLTTPLTAGLADGDLLEFVATNGVLIIQLSATQVAHIGSAVTTSAGTITGSATGDCLMLRYQASTNDWWATSVVGIWTTA